MYLPKKKSLLFLFLFVVASINAQTTSIADSLYQTILSSELADTQKVHNLNDLAWELMYEHGDSAKKFLHQSISLSKKNHFPKGEGQAYNNLGVVYEIQGDIDQAQNYYEKALTIRKSLKDEKGIASIYNNLGLLETEKGNYDIAFTNFRQSLMLRKALRDTLRTADVLYNMSYAQERMGNYPEALDYLFQHLELIEKLKDEYGLFNAYTLLANIKTELELYDEAQDYYTKALTIAQSLGEPYELSIAYNNIGIMLDDKGEQKLKGKEFILAQESFNKAIKNLKISLGIRIQNQDKEGMGDSYNNIGIVHKNLISFFLLNENKDSAQIHSTLALKNLEEALKIQQAFDNKQGIVEVWNGLGDVYRRIGNYKKALYYAKEYLSLAEEVNDQKFIQKAYKDLSLIYSKQKKYQFAFLYRKKYDEIRYKRLNEERVKQNARREAIYGDFQTQLDNEKKEKDIIAKKAQLAVAKRRQNSLIASAAVLILIALLLYNRYRIKNKANKALEEKNHIIAKEKKRSDDLLLNILPEETAQELKQHGKAAAKSYDAVTVLFSDIVSFTSIAEGLRAEDLVKMLDECFQAFDEISKKYGIEKIKTIGDAYMSVGGLPIPNDTHAINVVQAGLAMQTFSQKFNQTQKEKGLPEFRIRIGIHTGPVVAGIVGSSKFAYDIWGDTVNLASRMESAGEADRVNISRTTYELVKGHFETSYRGKIKVKNKGEVDMFFIENKEPLEYVKDK